MTIEVPNDHVNPENSQVIIVLTGEPLRIREQIKRIADEIIDPRYSKPIQGTEMEYKVVSTVITPIWESKTR